MEHRVSLVGTGASRSGDESRRPSGCWGRLGVDPRPEVALRSRLSQGNGQPAAAGRAGRGDACPQQLTSDTWSGETRPEGGRRGAVAVLMLQARELSCMSRGTGGIGGPKGGCSGPRLPVHPHPHESDGSWSMTRAGVTRFPVCDAGQA